MPDTQQRSVLMVTEDGADLPVTVTTLTVADGTVRATFDVDGSIWAQAVRERAFHCTPLTVGAGAIDFAADAPVTIDVQLAPDVAQVLAALDASGELVGALLAAPDPGVLARCSSWYARACTTPVTDLGGIALGPGESVTEGFRTVWGATPQRASLPLVGFVAEHLDRRGWSVQPLDETVGFTWQLTGGDATWAATVLVDEAAAWCAIYSVLPALVPESRRSDALARLNRLNLGLVIGSWELTDLGSLRMRTTVDAAAPCAAGLLIARGIDRHLDTFDEAVGAVVDLTDPS